MNRLIVQNKKEEGIRLDEGLRFLSDKLVLRQSKDRMWKIVCLISIALCVAEGCRYKDAECPDYTVVEKHSDYEVRRYNAITWASTSEVTRITRVAQYTTFMRLFRYIGGQNDREQKMDMTVPVRMQSTKGENGTLWEMNFMVPSEFAANPPVPNDDKIKIVKEDPTYYAVRTFPGYAWRQKTWEDEAEKLADSVRDDETVVKTEYYQVGYNAPFDLFDRRNEIWMVKKGNQENNLI